MKQLGPQDPERRNSPIASDAEDDPALLQEQLEELETCYFNDAQFSEGDVIQSGTSVLRCTRGVWVQIASHAAAEKIL
jgi:hypothetical protein